MTEKCPRCGMTAECDNEGDARMWGISHWDAYHTRHCPITGKPEDECRCHRH